MTPSQGYIAVYIAAATEQIEAARALRDVLRSYGIGCTARWLDLTDIPRESADGAETCLEDIERCDVFVLLNPVEGHRQGTGGRHTECGMAIALRKPLVLIGEAENVFHSRDWRAEIVPSTVHAAPLVATLRHAATSGTPLRDAVAPAGQGCCDRCIEAAEHSAGKTPGDAARAST